jgi:hypothetical protein
MPPDNVKRQPRHGTRLASEKKLAEGFGSLETIPATASTCPMACRAERCPWVCPYELDMLNRPTIKAQTPASWEEMLFCGLDPVTGEVAA